MKKEWECEEGVILKMIPFREHDQIVTLFTLNQGLVKLFFKGQKRKKNGSIQRYTPLMRVEAVFKERGELFPCEQLTVLHFYPALRNDFECLKTSCDLLQALLTSQLAGKASPSLYQLLLFYLDKIPLVKDPWLLAASFRLKILRHDGVLGMLHPEDGAIAFTPSDWSLVQFLSNCQSYRQLSELSLPVELRNKIALFFEEQIQK